MRRGLLVLIGGTLGSALRYGVFTWWFHRKGTFPFTTLAVNGLGAFALGALVAGLAAVVDAHRRAAWHAFAAVGFLGGFTTYSAYAVELAEYGDDGRPGVALLYAATMTVVGVAAAGFGRALAQSTLARTGRV